MYRIIIGVSKDIVETVRRTAFKKHNRNSMPIANLNYPSNSIKS